jgi:hypothetical protein
LSSPPPTGSGGGGADAPSTPAGDADIFETLLPDLPGEDEPTRASIGGFYDPWSPRVESSIVEGSFRVLDAVGRALGSAGAGMAAPASATMTLVVLAALGHRHRRPRATSTAG